MSVGFCGRAHVNTTVRRFKQQHPKSNAGRSVMVSRQELKEGFATAKQKKTKTGWFMSTNFNKKTKTNK